MAERPFYFSSKLSMKGGGGGGSRLLTWRRRGGRRGSFTLDGVGGRGSMPGTFAGPRNTPTASSKLLYMEGALPCAKKEGGGADLWQTAFVFLLKMESRPLLRPQCGPLPARPRWLPRQIFQTPPTCILQSCSLLKATTLWRQQFPPSRSFGSLRI